MKITSNITFFILIVFTTLCYDWGEVIGQVKHDTTPAKNECDPTLGKNHCIDKNTKVTSSKNIKQVINKKELKNNLGKSIAKSFVLNTFSCFFDHPYEYMFGSFPSEGFDSFQNGEQPPDQTLGQHNKPLKVKGKMYSTFIGGIHGILNYGGLLKCVEKFLGDPEYKKCPHCLGNYEIMEKLSGLSIYSKAMRKDKPFGYYNKDFIVWGYKNLIVPPDSIIAGIPARTLYNRIFAVFFRLVTESHAWLIHSEKIEVYKKEYLIEAEKIERFKSGSEYYEYKGMNAINWLDDQFKNVPIHYNKMTDGTAFTKQMAIGFWLRRSIDGTMDEIWVGLEKVMMMYDKAWLDTIKKKYPKR